MRFAKLDLCGGVKKSEKTSNVVCGCSLRHQIQTYVSNANTYLALYQVTVATIIASTFLITRQSYKLKWENIINHTNSFVIFVI